jgi:hypothetical protein
MGCLDATAFMEALRIASQTPSILARLAPSRLMPGISVR